MSLGTAPQTPPNRLVNGVSVFSRDFFRRGRRLTAAVVLFAVGILVVYMLYPTTKQMPQATYRQEPARQGDQYVQPVALPIVHPPVVEPPKPLPQPIQTAPPPLLQLRPQQLEVKEKPYVFNNSATTQLPAYLQKFVDQGKEGAKEVTGPDTSGIKFASVSYPGTKTFTIPDRSLLLMRWTTIPCVLDTQVVTGAGGETPFRCHTERDVTSPTGVVLLEAGTIIGGMYKSVVAEGDTRVIAITAEAQTPNGVIADIGGPVADELGGAGVPGSVDEHWWKRIGGALLLALVSNSFDLAQSYIQRNSQNTNINLSGGGGGGGGLDNIAQQLLAHTINIAPTITLNQGERVMLWTTKYIDFSASYKLETVR